MLSCAPAEVGVGAFLLVSGGSARGGRARVFAALAGAAAGRARGRPPAGRHAATRSPSQRAVATAAVSVLAELAASTPVVVAVDDVQWLDRASARVLEFAARRLDGSPVGFLLSLRDAAARLRSASTVRSAMGGSSSFESVRLSAGALHQLIKARLGGTFSRAALLRIHRATGGNPFYALELASSLLQAGPPAAGEAFPVPDDVRELVARRLRRLPATTREMLLFAAAMPTPDGRRAAACDAGVRRSRCTPGSRARRRPG